MARTLAVYGGSFNPPHLGHALVAQGILKRGVADRVLFVPSAAHPHGKQSVPFAYRMALLSAMVRDLTMGGQTPFLVSDVEYRLSKTTRGSVFTYDLLCYLRDVEYKHEDLEIRFVVGSDILDQTSTWHNWDQIQTEFGLVVFGREGYASPDNVPVIPGFSSSHIRDLIKIGGGWQSQVTPGVGALLPGPYQ